MVLQNSTSSSSDASTHDSSLSTPSYDFPSTESESDTSATIVQYELPFDTFPRPFPLVGPLLGFGEPRARSMLQQQLQNTTKLVKRPVTHEEATAMGYLTYKEVRTMGFGNMLGIAAGFYRAYTTRESWRLPFWKMSENFDPALVRLPSGVEILKGEAAKTFYRFIRMSAYVGVGGLLGTCLVLPYAAAVASAGFVRDPRLKDIVAVMIQQVKEERKARETGIKTTDPTGQGKTSTSDLWKNHRTAIGEKQESYDDASPTGGAGASSDLDMSFSEPAGENPGGRGFDNPQTSITAQATRNRRPFPTPSQNGPSSSDSSSDFFDDQDSNAANQSPSERTSTQSSGSSWERLRRNASGQSSSRPPNQRNRYSAAKRQGGDGESFSYSGEDRDRQLAKEEAQKDFDERMDRERRGEDFSGGRRSRGW